MIGIYDYNVYLRLHLNGHIIIEKFKEPSSIKLHLNTGMPSHADYASEWLVGFEFPLFRTEMLDDDFDTPLASELEKLCA